MVRDDGTGTAPAPGGGGSAADLELTIPDVEKIGRDTAALTTQATAAQTKLAAARGDGSAFGQYAPAQALFAQHQAVVQVFEATLGDLATDMDDFGNAIVQAVHNHAQTDDDVAAALVVLGTKVQPNSLKDRYDEHRNNAGYDLLDPDTELDTMSEVTAFDTANPMVGDPAIDSLEDSATVDTAVAGGSDNQGFGPSEPR